MREADYERPIKSFKALPADSRKVLEAKPGEDPDLVNPIVRNWPPRLLRFLARFLLFL